MQISVLVLDGVFDTGLAAICDTLQVANALASGGRNPFAVSRVGVRKRLTTGQGLNVPVDAPARRKPDLVLVPALAAKTPAVLDEALARSDVGRALDVLNDWHGRGVTVGAACTATFVLGAARLLDSQPATTTWWLAPTFRERFPLVRLDESRILIEAGPVVTAGAAVAHLDLALWVVRRVSPTLARETARYLAFDKREAQTSYAIFQRATYRDALVERFEAWARANLARFSTKRAARAIGTSQRTLERRLQQVLQKSPLRFVQDLRVADAVHRLETSDASLDEIAALVGYESGISLGNLLRKRTGLGVRALRARQ
ncbi:MAG TPA: helix-turn-helix domain-containing protein [Polyangiaceae bacterium]|nr:helix-turn-helix domain-containing protein [Polyangiaceae bacterium]